jgi:hypothetical protein
MAVLHQQCPTRSVETQERKPHPLINILQHYTTSSFLEKSRSKQGGKPRIAGVNDKKKPPNTTFAAIITFIYFNNLFYEKVSFMPIRCVRTFRH